MNGPFLKRSSGLAFPNLRNRKARDVSVTDDWLMVSAGHAPGGVPLATGLASEFRPLKCLPLQANDAMMHRGVGGGERVLCRHLAC